MVSSSEPRRAPVGGAEIAERVLSQPSRRIAVAERFLD
jgi:hypothetical protein